MISVIRMFSLRALPQLSTHSCQRVFELQISTVNWMVKREVFLTFEIAQVGLSRFLLVS